MMGRRSRRREAGEGWSRRRKLAVAGLVLALTGFGGGYLLATQALFPGPEPPGDLVEVPDLRGLSLEQARGALREAELLVDGADSLRHPDVARGEVLAQSPLPGQLAVPGAAVRLTVSLGSERGTIPDLGRVDGSRARAMLEGSGFTVVIDTVEAEVPPGQVVSVTPEAGTELTLPAEVRLAVSRGPASVEMPRLVGMTRDDAAAVLDSLGLVVGEIEEVFRFGGEQGRVVDQDPEPGTAVERGSAVRISVGRRRGG